MNNSFRQFVSMVCGVCIVLAMLASSLEAELTVAQSEPTPTDLPTRPGVTGTPGASLTPEPTDTATPTRTATATKTATSEVPPTDSPTASREPTSTTTHTPRPPARRDGDDDSGPKDVDLGIEQQVNTAHTQVGNDIEVNITVTYLAGEVPSRDVQIVYQTPPFLEIVHATTSWGTLTTGAHEADVAIPELFPKDVVRIYLRAHVTNQPDEGTVSLVAAVSTSTKDRNLSNNQSTAALAIEPAINTPLPATPTQIPSVSPPPGASIPTSAPPRLPGTGQADQRCFTETGFCIAGRIREFWEQNGGLPVFGLPTTPQQEELIEGKPFQVQWFERNRLELHPENRRDDPAGGQYDVLLGRLGAVALEQQQRNWYAFPKSEPQEGCRYFAETGQNVCSPLLEVWRANGIELDGISGTSEAESLALFGLPLSPLQEETLSDGKQYAVQWFERARFELHPENAAPYNVLLGLLGNEVRTGPQPVPTSPPVSVTPLPSTATPDTAATVTPTATLQGTSTPTAEAATTITPTAALEATATASPTPTSLPLAQRIAFHSLRNGTYDIYTMLPDSSELTRITLDLANDVFPAWSPDGSQIAFASDREGNLEIYVMNADGSGLTRVTDNPARDDSPSWSPDGQYLAFTSDRDGNQEIYVTTLDGAGVFRLTDDPAEDGFPAWSPDGLRIAYASNRDGNYEIYSMTPDGSDKSRLTRNDSNDAYPSWSPDTTRIAFASGRDGNWEIYVMNADGSQETRLTEVEADDVDPAWALDGTQIAFQSSRDANAEIYVMRVDGSEQSRLTAHPARDGAPAWSPR